MTRLIRWNRLYLLLPLLFLKEHKWNRISIFNKSPWTGDIIFHCFSTCQVFICIILLIFTTFLWNRYYHPYFTDKKSHSPKVDTDLKPSILWYAWLLFLIPSSLRHVVNLRRRKILVENSTGLSSLVLQLVGLGWVGFLFSGSGQARMILQGQ